MLRARRGRGVQRSPRHQGLHGGRRGQRHAAAERRLLEQRGEASGGTPTIGFGGFASATDVDGGVQILSPTLGFEQGPGDLLVLLINYDPLLTITQIGDASGNSYTQFGSSVSNADYIETMYYCLSAKPSLPAVNSVSVELSAVGATGQFSVTVYDFTARGFAWLQDQYINSSQNNVSSVTTGNVTTAYPNEVLVSGTGVHAHITAGSGGGWVTEPRDDLGDTQEFLIVDSIQTNIAATYTQSQPGIALSQLGTFAAR